MIRRPLWLVTGVALGIGGTLWAERRVREAAARLEPESMAREALDRAQRLGGRMRHAVETGRVASERRERELRRDLRLGPQLRTVRPPRSIGVRK